MAIGIKHFLKLDKVLLAAVFFLLAFGLMAIYSLSFAEKGVISNFEKQAFYVLVGGGLFFAFSLIDYSLWRKYATGLYLFGIMLLILVLFLGRNIRGTLGWFSFGFFNFQPVEVMKLFLVLFLAKYFSQGQLNFKKILTSLVFIVVPVFLAARQPDMGAAMVMMAIWLGMVWGAGIKPKQLIGIVLMIIIAGLASWSFFLKDYQKERIETFLNPQRDPLGSGYNVIQSVIAVGSGGIYGKGLGHGSQSQLNFLPEKHTDFIFAAIAEESGLVGAALVLLLFSILLYRLKKTAENAKDLFGSLLVIGVMTLIFFQVLINIGMNLGIMPVAGLSLPLVSYGGSFMLVILTALGIIQNIWKKRIKEELFVLEEE
jgi:rod shape determining protein RodA